MGLGKPLIRIPFATELLPSPTTIPSTARSLPGALAALQVFFTSSSSPAPNGGSLGGGGGPTVVLTGAGLSVASGLADYRGTKGTYRVNPAHRPIYYHEFLASHEARKRYWARSYLGWNVLHKAQPNEGHYALQKLGGLGLVSTVITQNVDSFHTRAHPEIPTLELHGYLRSTVCTSCSAEFARDRFQQELARLNPIWAIFLEDAIASGALDTGSLIGDRVRHFRGGIRINPDGDVELPDAPYTTFRYPACPKCLTNPPANGVVEVDQDGAWSPTRSTAGILKPAVVMFGENINNGVKHAAEQAIDGAGRLLILATSLATYSAWRLAKRAKDRGMPIAIVNKGGVRGEDAFFADLDPHQAGGQGVRVELSTDILLPTLVENLQQSGVRGLGRTSGPSPPLGTAPVRRGDAPFKDMLS
ncbi:SIR2 family histone deacetylase-like protein [Podospora didyma]|uniref:SIR2 family histone deacetylase-like protein n=1 Tax=Podospora didyma TaxID=330526 RepID=A0AAE0N9T2_9PEZI|nr:SIR2 family histone deacetylase-like protein [Podospora didyma]